MTRWRGALLGVVFTVAVAAGGLGTSCAAPTLPIPPPTALVSTPDASGIVTVTGTADPHAYVFALNDNTSAGVIAFAMPDGTFSIRLAAHTGDRIWVWQEVGDRASMQNMQDVP